MSPRSCMSVNTVDVIVPVHILKGIAQFFQGVGPKVLNINRPSVFNMRCISRKVEGRSLHHCMARLDHTISRRCWQPAAALPCRRKCVLRTNRKQFAPPAGLLACYIQHAQCNIQCHYLLQTDSAEPVGASPILFRCRRPAHVPAAS